MIRASSLCLPVRDEAGKSFCRVREIHIDNGQVCALICGSTGFLQRMTQSRAGYRIAWARVKQITPKMIVVADV